MIPQFLISNRFPGEFNNILGVVILLSVVLQSYSAAHISLYRNKYRRQDDTVYSIHIPSQSDGIETGQRNQIHRQEIGALNTSSHNPILFDIGCMSVYAGILMFVAIIAFCVPNAVEAPNSEKIFYFVHSYDLIVFFYGLVIFTLLYLTFLVNFRREYGFTVRYFTPKKFKN